MYRQAILDNGVYVLTEDMPNVRSVVVGIWADVGSRDEPPDAAGISHFIEHLMFKGTQQRTARDIAEALDAVGGQLNAFTTKEYTCYYARVMDEYFDLSLDVLVDMVLGSRFLTEDIDRERNVIAEEIKMYEDTPDELVHDVFTSAIWQEHALGRPIIGEVSIIESLDRSRILSYYQTYYSPANLIVAVAGNIRHQEVVEKVGAVLGSVSGAKLTRQGNMPVSNSKMICRKKDTEQVHLCIGVPGLPMDNENIYAVQLLNTILGGGISSRLFQEVRENRGLVYSIYSYHTSYHDAGLFCIYAGLSKNNVLPVSELVFKEIKAIRENGITEAELQRSKDQVKGNLFLSLENVTTHMSRLAKSKLYLERFVTPEEVADRISKVTRDEVRDVARAILMPESLAIAAVGPWDDCKILQEKAYEILT
ncbi:MAG TPA: peptidase M16 [Desulfotomaculum sp.]|nr:MAG: Processing peptidase [Desulfotomaculum sp. 46_80]HAG11694.1 peptidase M16 [Desulfotomaculum sp.]HBY05033.1 peptidase M16 [Desulfotomaculum sp.]